MTRTAAGRRSIATSHALVAAALAALAAAAHAQTDSQTDAQTDTRQDALRSYYTANGLLNRGLYEEAIPEYEAFLATGPDGQELATARYGLALSLSQLGRTEEALAQLADLGARDDFPFRFEADLLHGQLLYTLQRFDEAGRVLGRLARRAAPGEDPRAAEAAGLWIECLYREGRHEEAVQRARELMPRAAGAGGEFGRAALFAALSMDALGDRGDALETLRPLLGRGDEIGNNAALAAAGMLVRGGDLDEGAGQYERLAGLNDPRWSPAARLGLARVRRAQGQTPEAIALLRTLLAGDLDPATEAEARLELGIGLIESGEHEAGRRELAELGAESGSSDRAAYWGAKSLLRAGDAGRAVAALRECLDTFPDSQIRPEMLYDLGVALQGAGDAKGALAAFDLLLREQPGHRLAPPAQLAAAATLLQLGQFEGALARARAIEDEAPEAAEATLVLAEAEAMLGRHEQAAERLRVWLGEHEDLPSADRARYRLALSLAATGDLAAAESVGAPLLDADEIDGRFLPGLLALGDAAFEAEQWERAEHWYRRAVERGAEPTEAAQLKLGLALARQGRHAEAAQAFAAAAESNAGGDAALQALFELGQVRLLAGDDEGAREAFTKLLERGPESRFAGYALHHLGGIAERAGDAETAAALYATAASSSDDLRVSALRDQARASLAGEDYDALDRLASESDDPDLRAFAAIAAARRGDLRAGAAQLRKALGSRGLSDDVRRSAVFELAWCQRRLGEDDDAMGTLEALLEEDTTDRFTIYGALEAASLELDGGRAEHAGSWLERAAETLDANPSLAEPPMQAQLDYRLAQLDAAAGRHREVIDRLERFAQDHPESPLAPAADLLLGDAYIAADRARDAVRAYERASAAGAGDLAPAATLRLGDALARAGMWAESRERFEEFLSKHADSPHAYEARFGIGWALEHEGRHEEAREAYGAVVASHKGPTAARAQFQIGECLFAEEKFDEAVRELLRVDILYDYPEWSAAALYEAGRAFEQLRKFGEARRQFRDTIDRFPDSDWAPLARERLDRLASAGED